VSLERGVVRLADDVWTDVAAFEAAAAAGDSKSLAGAVTLYEGDLLPDDPYSDALGARREFLRQRFIDVALRLARAQTDSDPDRKIDTLRRLLVADPTLEEAHRLLMTVLADSGRRKDAIRQFTECTKMLREHLNAQPSAETQELRHRIGRGDAASSAGKSGGIGWSHVASRLLGTADPPAIRGRPEALSAVREFAEGESGVLLIVGEPGVGKTRLAVECIRHASQFGATVLGGLGYEFDGTAPYTPFVDAWADHMGAIGGSADSNPFLMFAPTPEASAQEDRLRLFQTVERSIVDLAGDSRVCLVLEDLHQSDESSLQLFHHLARAARHLPLQLVGTLREEEIQVGRPVHTLTAGLERERLARRVTLKRLDVAGTRELIADLWQADADPQIVESIFEITEGNPFFTEEVVRTMREQEAPAEPCAPQDLLRAVRERVARLGPDADRLFVTAAVQGLRFDFEVARSALGMDSPTALDALDLGLAGRIVEEADGHYRFHHALTRQALYVSLSRARRVYLHRATAEILETREGDSDHPELLAFHHQAAGQIDRALPYLMAAARRAQARLGFNEAVRFCERALELMDALAIPPGPERLEALQSMGAMRVALGDLDRAVANLEVAAGLHRAEDDWRPTGPQRANALRLAALANIEGGDLDAAERRLTSALEILEGEPDTAELSSVFYLFSQLRWHQSRHDEAFALAEKCLLEAERLDNTQAIAKGYEMLALACHSLGEWKKGTEYEEQRHALADGALDVASAFDVHL